MSLPRPWVDGRTVGTGRRIVLRPVHRGARITVRVVGRKRGYGSTSATSARTSVVRGR